MQKYLKDVNRFFSANHRAGLSIIGILTTTVHAGIPIWSIIPNESPIVTVSATGSVIISYTVTNNAHHPHQLVLSSKTPTGISQLGGPCMLAAKSLANPTPTCTLTLTINGHDLPADSVLGGPILCQATTSDSSPNTNQCYQPSSGNTLMITRTTTPGTTTLSTSIPSPAILALSINDTATNAALTGHARQLIITNTGPNAATNLSVVTTGLPIGTDSLTIPTTCIDTLASGATCTVTINPGIATTSNCSITKIAPTPGTITVSATNATAVTSDVVVLSYGCQYQGGFLFSIDDTTNRGVTNACSQPPCVGSIGGKIASLTDQAAPYTTAPQATGSM